jgi:hypothetical protein
VTSEVGQRGAPPPASGGYPCFSAAELRRRHDALAAVMDAHGVDHVPNAARIATECDVRWIGERPLETALEEVRRRGADGSDASARPSPARST